MPKVRTDFSNDNIVLLRRMRGRGGVLCVSPGHRDERGHDTDDEPGAGGVCEDPDVTPGGEGKEYLRKESPNLSSTVSWSMKRGSKADLCSVSWDECTDTGPLQRQISRAISTEQSQTDTEDNTFGVQQPIGGGRKGNKQHGQANING